MISDLNARWFQFKRGITTSTLVAHGVGSKGDAVSFPYPTGEKLRYGLDGERRFTFTKGAKPGLFGLPNPAATVTFLCEGETDTMRLWQSLHHLPDVEFEVFGLSGIDTWQDGFAADMHGKKVVVILDNDADYMVRARVEAAYTKIRAALGNKVVRVHLPADVKDVCEFFDGYDLEAFRGMVNDAGQGRTHYEALDLISDPPVLDWLVDGLIHKGDLTLLTGEQNVGKSWITMSLAVAIAMRNKTWLGKTLDWNRPRILYVDEENPRGLILRRLHQLGLTRDGASNIRYLCDQGVRLDKNPDRLIDEALNWQPELIVLDSLTRLHNQEENHSGVMSGMFNDVLKPLSRELGSAVIYLHHVNKGDSNNSAVKVRGSSDITAAPDTAIEARRTGPGNFRIIHFKSRWADRSDPFDVSIQDQADESVRLVLGSPGFDADTSHAPF